jgi:hypothetical protein
LEHDLRVEQICALKWAHVDIEAGSLNLQLPRPKPPSAAFRKSLEMLGVVQSPENVRRLSTQVVPLNKGVANLFREIGYLSKRGSTGLVFIRDRGPMTRRAVEMMVGRHSKSAGIKATVRTLSQTYSANQRRNTDPFGFDRISNRSKEETFIPLPTPSWSGRIHDTFNDLQFNNVAIDLELDLFVSAYSTLATRTEIRKAVLKRANGRCERCGFSFGNSAYLDVHHIIPTESVNISEGKDRYNNCVALCPNCHREAHLKDRWEAVQSELSKFVQQFGPNPPDDGQSSDPQTAGRGQES